MGPGREGMRCIKILLFIFNLTFWAAGLAVISFGLWLRFGGVMAEFASDKRCPEYFFMGILVGFSENATCYMSIKKALYLDLTCTLLFSVLSFVQSFWLTHVFHFVRLYVLVGAGALMTTVGLFGCCGASRESQCLLGAFFACLLVIFAAEITAGVFTFIGKKGVIQEAQKLYEDIYDDYMKNPEKVNGTIYRYHSALQCCGKGSTEQQMGLPCPENIQMPKNCLVEIQNVIDAYLHLVGIAGIAIAGITIFGMIFSMVLCCAIRNTRDMI